MRSIEGSRPRPVVADRAGLLFTLTGSEERLGCISPPTMNPLLLSGSGGNAHHRIVGRSWSRSWRRPPEPMHLIRGGPSRSAVNEPSHSDIAGTIFLQEAS